jgi:hypothetical protein
VDWKEKVVPRGSGVGAIMGCGGKVRCPIGALFAARQPVHATAAPPGGASQSWTRLKPLSIRSLTKTAAPRARSAARPDVLIVGF